MNRESSPFAGTVQKGSNSRDGFGEAGGQIGMLRNFAIGAGVAAALGLVLSAGLVLDETRTKPLLKKRARIGVSALVMALMAGVVAVLAFGGEAARHGSSSLRRAEDELTKMLKEVSGIDKELDALLQAYEKAVGEEVDGIRARIMELVTERKVLAGKVMVLRAQLIESRQKIEACEQQSPVLSPAAHQVAKPVDGFENTGPVYVADEFIETTSAPVAYPFDTRG